MGNELVVLRPTVADTARADWGSAEGYGDGAADGWGWGDGYGYGFGRCGGWGSGEGCDA